ncbi:MAG: PilZ domain-containing protein [Acidobacteriota bacterium]|nr:PilZ domain-containing protein [Acidobacteriota bacterium]
MRPLTSALSRDQLSELLDVPVEVIDALLDSGRVLCQFKGGEPRVPLTQLEAFFRDALLRLYQAEGQWERSEVPRVPRSSTTSTEELLPEELRGTPRNSEEPEEPEAVEPPPEPAPMPAIVQPAPAPPPMMASPAPHQRRGQREEDQDREQRVATRYVPLRQLTGIFGDTKFNVMQLSATGLRIRHNEPLMPGDEAKLSFALLKPARSVVVRAKVVWTSIARSGNNERFSISGLRITEHGDRLSAAIDSLRAANELQPERREGSRRATDTMSVLSGISDEEMALVTAAVQKFAADPVEASRWYSRARFALSDESVRRAAPDRPREREEVLGIWEYLERQVEIGKIAGVVTWMRTNAGPASTRG